MKEFGSDIAEFIAIGTAVKAEKARAAAGRQLAQQQEPAVHLRPVGAGLWTSSAPLRAVGW
jgi:hypothetical protein